MRSAAGTTHLAGAVEAIAAGMPESASASSKSRTPGIASAKSAGMTAIAIPHRLTELHDLSGADLRVAHAGELTVERLAALVRR